MALLTVPELRDLIAENHEGPCISLYQPTTRKTNGSEEARIRFGNLVRRAGALLEDRPKREVQPLLHRLNELSTREFWNHQLEGLAVFCSPNLLRDYQLTISVPELAIVADTFHVRPLLRSLQADRQYFLLDISEKHVRFCRGSSHGLEEIEVPGLPSSLVDALGPERREPQLQQHTGGHAGTTRENTTGTGMVFHGHGVDLPTDEDTLRYLRAVDAALFDLLKEEKSPLILCAPETYHPAYRSVTRYGNLMAQGIQGSFKAATTDDLHQRAWPLVEKGVQHLQEQALEKFGNLLSQGRSTDELTTVARAAVEGRIDTLLLADGRHEWGRLDRKTGELRLRPEQREDQGDDVLDDVAELVILRGGEVFALEPSKMPNGSTVGATFRW